MRYDLLLSDADGTLFDFHAGERRALRATLESFRIAADDEICALYSRVNLRHWKRLERGETTQQRLRVERFEDFLAELRGLGAACDGAEPRAMSDVFVDQLSRQRVPMAGAEDFLRTVSARMPIYLVTNGIASVQRGRFERSELRPYFQDLLISEELGHFKPDPYMVEEAMRRAGVTDPRRTVLLGDSVTADIGAAKNAGVDAILFTNGEPAPADSGATWCVPTLEEAARLIVGD